MICVLIATGKFQPELKFKLVTARNFTLGLVPARTTHYVMFHEVVTVAALIHPIESANPAAREKGIPLIVLLEAPRHLEGRPVSRERSYK